MSKQFCKINDTILNTAAALATSTAFKEAIAAKRAVLPEFSPEAWFFPDPKGKDAFL